MCSSTTTSFDAGLDATKLAKFVELLVHDYLQAKGFAVTREKFAEECSKCARRDLGNSTKGHQDVDSGSSPKSTPIKDESSVDEASAWYSLAEKLALPELVRQNEMAPAGQRFATVMEMLVQELVRERASRSRAPSSVSIVSVRDSKGRRKPVGHQPSAILLDVSRSKSTVDLAATCTGALSDISRGTTPQRGSHESAPTGAGELGPDPFPGVHGCGSSTSDNAGESKARCKTSPLNGTMGVSRNVLSGRGEGAREGPRKHHTCGSKRGNGHSSPPKGSRTSNAGGILKKFQLSKDAIRRQQMSHENWIPDDLRMKMMRRSIAVIKENVYESVAQGSLVRKEKKRSGRSELEIVKTQEKFGTKHQRPCALCEQSFSEVNLILAVPFKAIVDLRIAWQKALPQAKGSTTKTNRTMLMPPQCYNEVKVCAFCSQLFHDPLGYRPTWDMEVLSMRQQWEEEAREKEREYWDPLRKSALDQNRDQHVPPAAATQNDASPVPLDEA